ncbi:general transcription factor IIH subunit 3-like isoform X2 [Monomorium pharaonis]|uniref:general transcription factor IIH subunit 3 isoform X2 n=1 Tax=Monomorium pharaonis TaxID=307658 RepID=UPI0017478D8B|nr:general transcription factor IIH subunit 3 isoform X2 [Monomorium pharaonis]XP_036150508.1 general transcription factor IIH subunit 3-like isoform X2 [Monomorium pharaonis]
MFRSNYSSISRLDTFTRSAAFDRFHETFSARDKRPRRADCEAEETTNTYIYVHRARLRNYMDIAWRQLLPVIRAIMKKKKKSMTRSRSQVSSSSLEKINKMATAEIRQMDDQYEKFTMMEHTVRQQLQRIISENILLWAFPMNIPLNISLISGALNMALCYIARLKSEKIASQKLHPRILVITASNDSATQYMNYMNIFFTAQRMNVILDVCSLDQELTLLQQGCDITGGNYLKVPQLDELLQDLLCVFLPDPSVRSELVLPSPVKVDYRAACFCHQELIDIGYVCSKCFTIFCKFNSICTTCHTVFKMPGRMSMKMKNKSMCGSRRTLFVYSVTVEYLKQQRLKDIVKYVIWIMKCFAALIIFLNLYYNSLYDTIPIDLRIHGITFDGNQTTYCSGPPSKDTI